MSKNVFWRSAFFILLMCTLKVTAFTGRAPNTHIRFSWAPVFFGYDSSWVRTKKKKKTFPFSFSHIYDCWLSIN
jgi:hypothetical protein